MNINVLTTTKGQGFTACNLNFQINGTVVNHFNSTAPVAAQTVFAYNTPVLVKENLPLGRHRLTILNGGGSSRSLLLLDRIIYT